MPKNNNPSWRAFLIFLSLLTGILGWASNARSENAAQKEMGKSLVYLTASGIDKNGAPLETQATGFVISSDGYILTVYHLLSELKDVVPETVIIRANIGEKTEEPKFRVSIMNAIELNDLLLLKLPRSNDNYVPVKLATLDQANAADEIFSSGFPQQSQVLPIPIEGKVQVREGPLGYLWTVQGMTFGKGSSGSPVFTDDGTVIGAAKGQDKKDPTLNYMIPIQLADALIVTVRFAKMQKEIAELNEKLNVLETKKVDPTVGKMVVAETSLSEIASSFLWSVKSSNEDIIVEYKKLASNSPTLQKISISLTSDFVNELGKVMEGAGGIDTDFDQDGEPDTWEQLIDDYNVESRQGKIVVKGAALRMKNFFCSNVAAVASNTLEIGIEAYLGKDGAASAEDSQLRLDPQISTIFFPMTKDICPGKQKSKKKIG